MFGIGLPELILIMIVALLVVGPKKLPELAKSVGKALHNVKSMTDDVKQSFEEDFEKEDQQEPEKTEAGGEEEPREEPEKAEATVDHEAQGTGESEAKPGPGEASSPDSPDTTHSDGYGNLRG